jgi:hypothetical protein
MKHEFRNIILPTTSEPKSEDKKKDQYYLSAILNDIYNNLHPRDVIVKYSDNLTDWISWQLGLYFEYIKKDVYDEGIINYGTTSILAADFGGWTERQGSNRNGLAGYLLQFKQFDVVQYLCNAAIDIVSPYYTTVYASAHSILAAVEMFNNNYFKATIHFDSMFRVLKPLKLTDELKSFAITAELAYKKSNDVAGSFFIETLLKSKEEAYARWETICPKFIQIANFELILSTYSKFISYDLNEFAQQLKKGTA